MVDDLLAAISGLLNDNVTLMTMFALAVASSGLVLIIEHVRRRNQDVQRRIMAAPGEIASVRLASGSGALGRTRKVLEGLGTASAQVDVDDEKLKVLRGKLVQAGYYDRRAVPLFFGIRIVTGLTGAGAVLIALYVFFNLDSLMTSAMFSFAGGVVGYMIPAILLDRRIEACRMEHRAGFPDFMDLMVVCSQAGLSMEAGIQKISAELSSSYPSLARNLEMTTVEIRSGKTLSRAIEALGKRLGIEEATSFATLLTQSEELGSSLTQSLRAYSDDMRNKRLMKAEEKAFSLPAKLVVPLTLFVFPTLLVVLLLPVVISVSKAGL